MYKIKVITYMNRKKYIQESAENYETREQCNDFISGAIDRQLLNCIAARGMVADYREKLSDGVAVIYKAALFGEIVGKQIYQIETI